MTRAIRDGLVCDDARVRLEESEGDVRFWRGFAVIEACVILALVVTGLLAGPFAP